MALKYPVDNAVETQGWGSSPLAAEPAMYSDGKTAWWNPYPGASFFWHFHAALDIAAPQGTPIWASEDGTVIESYYDSVNGGGNKVRIQIRPGISYCSNHMFNRAVSVGQKVKRGQLIGRVGSTGNSTGPHNHFWVGIDDAVGSQTWPRLFNPKLFFYGGALANDARIQPLQLIPYVTLKGPGINIRTSPDLDVGSSNVFATSQADGIYRNGKRLGPLSKHFEFMRNVTTDDGRFAKVIAFNRNLYIYRDLVDFHKS